MCDCSNKIKSILQNHKRCRWVEVESIIEEVIVQTIQPIVEPKKDYMNFDNIQVQIIELPTVESVIEEEEEMELTDISPQELIEQEAQEKRIQDELSLIQLTKLLKKKPRKLKEPI